MSMHDMCKERDGPSYIWDVHRCVLLLTHSPVGTTYPQTTTTHGPLTHQGTRMRKSACANRVGV